MASLSDDSHVTLVESDGHSGPGFYAWLTEYPDEGSAFFQTKPTTEELAEAGFTSEL
jgi:hypothetical protein